MLLIVVDRQEADVDISFLFSTIFPLLSHIGIGMTQLFGTLGIVLQLFLILLLGCLGKESVVELNDSAL